MEIAQITVINMKRLLITTCFLLCACQGYTQTISQIKKSVWDDMEFLGVKLAQIRLSNGNPSTIQDLYQDFNVDISDRRIGDPGQEKEICFTIENLVICFTESYNNNYEIYGIGIANPMPRSIGSNRSTNDLKLGASLVNVGSILPDSILNQYSSNLIDGEKSLDFSSNPYDSMALVLSLNNSNEVTRIYLYAVP